MCTLSTWLTNVKFVLFLTGVGLSSLKSVDQLLPLHYCRREFRKSTVPLAVINKVKTMPYSIFNPFEKQLFHFVDDEQPESKASTKRKELPRMKINS